MLESRAHRTAGRVAAFAACLVLAAGRAAAADTGRAEVQFNLCAQAPQVRSALKLQAQGAPTRVWLFDTPALELAHAGLRLRLRQRGAEAELTLKVAGQDCASVDRSALGKHGKCETDLHGQIADDVVSLSRKLKPSERDALLGAAAARGPALVAALLAALDRRQHELLSRQRQAALAGAPLLPPDLVRAAAAQVQAYRSATQPYVVEVWSLPGGEHFSELSQKTPRDNALSLQAQLRQTLDRSGVAVCADQDSQAAKKLQLLLRPAAR